MTLNQFFDSPSNRTGLCLIVGAIPPLATFVLSGSPKEIAVASFIGTVCSGVLKILQPDNTVTQAQLTASKTNP